MLAATASTRSTPLWRSNTTGSPVWASTAVMSTVRCGQCWLGSRAATVARHRAVPGAVRRRIELERRRTQPAAHVGRILAAAMISLVLADGRPPARRERVHRRIRPDAVRCWGAAARMSASSSGRARTGDLGRGRRSGRRPDDQIGLGHIQPGIEQAGDDADQPGVAGRSAATEDQRSLASRRSRLRLTWSDVGRSAAVVEVTYRVEKGVVFMGVAFRELPGGRSRWRLPQSRDRGLQGSTHCGYCVHGSHLLPMDHDRHDASTGPTAAF